MKFLVVLCLLAIAAAEEDKIQDKKTQPTDPTQSTSGLPAQTTSLLNSQVFSSPSFFGTNDAVSNLAYTGLNPNVSPIQPVNPDFFASSQQVVTAAPIPAPISAFPVTRAVLPGSSSVVGALPSGIQSGIQSAFPVAGGVFPAAVNGIAPQIPAITQPYIQPVSAVPAQFATGVVDPNIAAANGAIPGAQASAYRFLPAEGLTGIPTQGLQTVQQVGLAAIPAFTSGILPTFANGALQGQNIPAGIQQVLKNPAGAAAGIPQTLATSSLGNIYRQA